MKPEIKILNAFVMGNRLYGDVLNYPVEHEYFPGAVNGDGTKEVKSVVTSTIVRVDGDTIETERSIYKVQSWVAKTQS